MNKGESMNKVFEFRFLKADDPFNVNDGNTWSRIYEYHWLFDRLTKYCSPLNTKWIHNTAWGYEGSHIDVRDKLNSLTPCAVHTDICKSDFRPTLFHDITSYQPFYNNMFDVVINISTIEHCNCKPDIILSNLMSQVKPMGFLFVTFDYPRVDLANVELYVKTKCVKEGTLLTGQTSAQPNLRYSDLSIVVLALQKI